MFGSCFLWKSSNSHQTRTDNFLFWLHYKLTFIILLFLSILVAYRQTFGGAISCISRDEIPTSILNSYCYRHAVYSTEEAWKKKVGEEVPYPGIGKYNPNETKIYYSYYPWVSLALFVQAFLFLVPRYLWKFMESGMIKDMTSSFKTYSINRKENLMSLADDLLANANRNVEYFLVYSVAEMLNLVNVVVQFCWMNTFLGGAFSNYGFKVMETSTQDWSNLNRATLRIFPGLVKCTFNLYGSSGDVQRHDVLCNLPLNSLNEKIYAFLWFWFVILAALTSLGILYRFIILLSTKIRMYILKFRARLIGRKSLMKVLQRGNVGDWFVLHLLCKNMKRVDFRDLLLILAEASEKSGGKITHMED